ncbi:MAG TPA: hypothetical protein VN417_02210 [Candidatus Cryosericum sp.]|nr:hypothetical protein [Candidatus Cryosericum sp.]
MNKKTLAIVLLLTMIAPFVLYVSLDRIRDYIPPTEPYKKTPYQFEKAFNEQMAQYGMSIDIDSVDFTHDGDYFYKTVPIKCEDGSIISCTYEPTSEGRKSLIQLLEFEQSLSDSDSQTIYIQPLLEFILQEFEAPMLDDKDKIIWYSDSVSYNTAVQYCQEFVSGTDRELEFYVASDKTGASPVNLRRYNGEGKSIRIRIVLFSTRRSW